MKKWMEKEYSNWVCYDDIDGLIIGASFKIGNTNSVWGAKVYQKVDSTFVEKHLGQYIDSDYARKSVENYWDIQDRTLLQ